MASTDARPIPIKNTAFRAVFPLLDADGDLVTGATGLDSEVSKDQGAFSDCTNEATEIATSSGLYYLDLTSTEMNADCVAVIVKTSTSGAKTTVLVFYPQESGDIKVDMQSVAGTSQTARDIGASVLLSSGTGTGQVSLSSGAVLLQATQTGVTIPTVTTLTNAPSDSSGVTTLLSRLSSARAGYLDNLSAGAVALASTFTGITSLAQWLGLLAGKQTGNSTARTEVRATGAGSGTFDETTDSLEAARDNVGTAGAGLTAADDAVITAVGALPTANAIADQVWDEVLSGHLTGGSTGAGLNAAGSAGDPWATSLPGAYSAGTAGKILGDNLNATVSSRATQTSVDAVDDLIDTEIADIQSRLPAALVGGKIDANVGAISGDTVAADNLEAAADGTGYNLGGGAVVAASVTAGVTVTTNNDKTGYSVGSGGIGASSFAAGAIDSAAIAASAIGASELAQDAAREIADEVLDRDIAGGASGGARNVRSALRRLRNRARVSGGTATIYQEDDTTSAWTAAVTTTAGDPVSEVDPA